MRKVYTVPGTASSIEGLALQLARNVRLKLSNSGDLEDFEAHHNRLRASSILTTYICMGAS